MQKLVAVVLALISVGLWWTWRKHKISNDSLNALAGIFTVISGLAAIAALLIPSAQPQPLPILTPTQPLYIQMIDFNYVGSPIKHEWFFVQGIDTSQVVFNPIYENKSVRGIEIYSPTEWGMDIKVEPAAKQFGKILEFIIVPRQDAAIYTFINIERSDGTKSTGWLKFMFCDDEVQSITREGKGNDEWRVCLVPVSHEGDWLLFRVNLIDEVKRTFSKDGWSFSWLNKIRIRGNISLDYISILEE